MDTSKSKQSTQSSVRIILRNGKVIRVASVEAINGLKRKGRANPHEANWAIKLLQEAIAIEETSQGMNWLWV